MDTIWSDLPIDILELFLDRLIFADHVHFGAVCKSWRSAAAKHHHHHRRAIQLPWLFLSKDPTWGFFSPAEGRAYHLDLPVPCGNRCSGASHGWFFMTDCKLGNHYLLNPFTNQQIQIPDIPTVVFEYPPSFSINTRRAILSSPPPANDNRSAMDCVVVATTYGHGSELVLCRPGDETWSDFPKVPLDHYFSDFIFREGLLYCINYREEVVVFEFGPQPTAKAIYRPKRIKDYPRAYRRTFYLVESAGELLLVVKHRVPNYKENLRFSVFKLDPTATEWIQVKSLGDGMLFLGKSRSKYITPGFKPNCIYFTQELGVASFNSPLYMDWGIFCLDDGDLHPYYHGSQSFMSSPLWIMLKA